MWRFALIIRTLQFISFLGFTRTLILRSTRRVRVRVRVRVPQSNREEMRLRDKQLLRLTKSATEYDGAHGV